MKSIRNFIKQLDIFGIYMNFHYKNEEKYKTATGGILFILLILIVFIYVLINLDSFINRKNYNSVIYDKQLNHTDIIEFNSHNSKIAFNFLCDDLDEDSEFYEIFEFDIQYVSFTPDKNLNKKTKNKQPINLNKCKPDYFENYNNPNINDISSLLCPDDFSFLIQGIYIDDIFSYLEISLKVKDNFNNYKYLEKRLNNYECKINIFHLDSLIDVSNYKKPLTISLLNKYIIINSYNYKKMNLYFKYQTFMSDTNFLFDSYKTNKYLKYESNELYDLEKGYNRFVEKPDKYNYFAKIFIRAGSINSIIQRKYQKLTEFAANMSSLFSQIYLLLFITVTYLNRMLCYNSIMNKIFQFTSETQNKKKKISVKEMNKLNENNDKSEFKYTEIGSKKSNNIEVEETPRNKLIKSSLINTSSKNNKILIHLKNNNNNDNETNKKKSNSNFSIKKFQNKIKNTMKIKLNYCETFKVYLCFCCLFGNSKKKYSFLFKSKVNLYYHLDILTYLIKMQQIEILNYVILEDYKYKIIQFLSKPSISLINDGNEEINNNNMNVFKIIKSQNDIKLNNNEIDIFFQNYLKLKGKKPKSKMDLKLIKLCEAEIKTLLNK